MDTNLYRIPRYLDEPDKIFFFYTDEIVFGFASFLVLNFLTNWFIGIGGLILAIRLKRKYRKTRWANIFQSFVYWHFPAGNKGNGLPRSSIREYL